MSDVAVTRAGDAPLAVATTAVGGLAFRKQVNLHDEGCGVFGDCWRTSYANLLGLRPEEVPHFMDRDAGHWDGDPFGHAARWLACQSASKKGSDSILLKFARWIAESARESAPWREGSTRRL